MKLFYINIWNLVIWLINFLMLFFMFSYCVIFVFLEFFENIGWILGLYYWDILKIFKVYEKFCCVWDKYKVEVFRI